MTISSIAKGFFSASIRQDRPVVIALSGGVDSVVLAELANRNRQPGQVLQAIHVHHGLSSNADNWANFIESLCKSMNIQLTVCRVKLNKKAGESLEDVARKARYQALYENSPSGAQILLAHHLDDQLETMLIGLKRGSGALRLRGMAPTFDSVDGKSLIRPLLEVSKEEIMEFANSEGLHWVEDESNKDSCFDRNFLRNEIIPMMKKRWGGLLTATKRSARILFEENEIVQIHAKQILSKSMNPSGELIIEELKQLKDIEIKLAIRHWIMGAGCVAPREDKTLAIFNEVALAKQGQKPEYKIAGAKITRNKGFLHLDLN